MKYLMIVVLVVAILLGVKTDSQNSFACMREYRCVQIDGICYKQVNICRARALSLEVIPGQPKNIQYLCGGVIGYNCSGWETIGICLQCNNEITTEIICEKKW